MTNRELSHVIFHTLRFEGRSTPVALALVDPIAKEIIEEAIFKVEDDEDEI
jgi:hypothetical protein